MILLGPHAMAGIRAALMLWGQEERREVALPAREPGTVAISLRRDRGVSTMTVGQASSDRPQFRMDFAAIWKTGVLILPAKLSWIKFRTSVVIASIVDLRPPIARLSRTSSTCP